MSFILKKLKFWVDKNTNSKNVFFVILGKLKICIWKIKTYISWKTKMVPYSVQNTKSYLCEPLANVSVHTLTGHKYLNMYIISIKSLLRFYNNFRVIVHDDGTLTKDDFNILERNIVGVKIIGYKEANDCMNRILTNFKRCFFLRKKHIISFQLFDYSFLSDTDKIVSLDSDTLFFKRPEQLIKWMEEENKDIIGNFEEYSFYQDEHMKKLRLKYEKNFNLGFVCFYKNIMDLELIEETLNMISNDEIHFCTFQYVFSVLIKKCEQKYKFSFFDKDKYQTRTIFKPNNPVFKHYLSSSGLLSEYLKDYKKIVKEI